jgi:hypothetical protein
MFTSRAARAIAVLIGLSLLMPSIALNPPVVAAKGSCTGWQSILLPPDTIRVFRKDTGVVEVVPFKDYVVTVAAKEWPGWLPTAVIEAGTVAVKQYAWFHAMEGRHRGRYMTEAGECYDVRDSTADQLYKPAKARITPRHYEAVEKTWALSLRKNNRQLMTGYRSGRNVDCASDATGWKLFAKSAIKCANIEGYDWLRILDAYYSPGLQFVMSDGTIINVDGVAIGDAAVIDSTLPADATTTTFDERHAAIDWQGDWRRTRSKRAYGRTLTYTLDSDASAVFQVAGRSLDIVGRKGPKHGRLLIYVDDELWQIVDTWAPTRQHQQAIFSATWADPGVRTIRLELDEPSERPRIDIDAIVVQP